MQTCGFVPVLQIHITNYVIVGVGFGPPAQLDAQLEKILGQLYLS